LLRLPAPGLRGTWARAYALLTRLVSKIGWDELLKTRSTVFVMEEEYRQQKAQSEAQTANTSTTVIHEDGSVTLPGDSSTLATKDADDNASTKGVRSTSGTPLHSPKGSGTAQANGEGASDADVDAVTNGIPTIRLSTESSREKTTEDAETDVQANGEAAGDALERPMPSAAGEGSQDESSSGQSQSEAFSFSNKRLCERWLDNLFMVLYEDLRVWTIFRAEVAHFKTQHVAYRKTGMEWEILGDLGLRLHHKEEAKEAYQRCLDGSRYSAKPWMKLMDMYADEGDIQRTLQVGIRVAAYQYGEYAEMTASSLSLLSCFASAHALPS
jgi:Chs5-Arf1p-binding protein BUD7/BCH1